MKKHKENEGKSHDEKAKPSHQKHKKNEGKNHDEKVKLSHQPAQPQVPVPVPASVPPRTFGVSVIEAPPVRR